MERICCLIVDGNSLNRISQMEEMPTLVTFWTWLKKYPDFLSKYRDARNFRAEVDAGILQDMADDPLLGQRIEVTTNKGKDGKTETKTVEYDNVERAKLMVSTRQWIVSKLLPKKYGDGVEDSEHEQKGLEELKRVMRAGPIDNPNGDSGN